MFWAHASNAARLEQSYRDFASCVKVPGRQNPKSNIFKLMHNWLRDEGKGKWVLILDNVDDASYLVEARDTSRNGQTSGLDDKRSQPLMSYVPRCQNGSVLVTTRSRHVVLQLVEQRDMIAVEPMDKRDALALLQKKLGQQDSSEEGVKGVVELAAALEFMPLAMVQAAAYISQRRPRCSVQQYLRDIRRSDRKRIALLESEGGQLRRDWEAKNSIIVTWQISFDHIRQVRTSAADLLALMSFYDRQGIPEALLRRPSGEKTAPQGREECDSNEDDWGEDEDTASQLSASDTFEDDIQTLRDYSFISVNADGAPFEMHRLVQLATRKWLEDHNKLEEWKQNSLRNLCAAIPTGRYENWTTCQTLFPHAKSAAGQQPVGDGALEDWATILYRAACYAWVMSNWIEAEKMSTQAKRVREKILGREHEDTLDSIEMEGLVYNDQGRWEAAEALLVEVMEARKKKLGADHPGTLASMSNLASTYRRQGRWDAAEELDVQVLETRKKKKLGADHPGTLASMSNLASTYRRQGRWDAAEELDVQVLEARKKKLGADHPDTLASMNNLALIWERQSRAAEAIKLMGECVQSRRHVLGASHPYYLSSLRTLAQWEAEQVDLGPLRLDG